MDLICFILFRVGSDVTVAKLIKNTK